MLKIYKKTNFFYVEYIASLFYQMTNFLSFVLFIDLFFSYRALYTYEDGSDNLTLASSGGKW